MQALAAAKAGEPDYPRELRLRLCCILLTRAHVSLAAMDTSPRPLLRLCPPFSSEIAKSCTTSARLLLSKIHHLLRQMRRCRALFAEPGELHHLHFSPPCQSLSGMNGSGTAAEARKILQDLCSQASAALCCGLQSTVLGRPCWDCGVNM